MVVTVSDALADFERAAGRDVAGITPSAADSFPELDPRWRGGGVTGPSAWRVDWRLVRRLRERMGSELTLLLIGKVAEDGRSATTRTSRPAARATRSFGFATSRMRRRRA